MINCLVRLKPEGTAWFPNIKKAIIELYKHKFSCIKIGFEVKLVDNIGINGEKHKIFKTVT